MNSGQTLLTIGGIMLLSFIILTFYTSEGSSTEMTLFNESLITCTGIAQTVIEEMAARDFDEFTINNVVDSPDSLTLATSLGAESGETGLDLFDDFDDFNNYEREDILSRLDTFRVHVNVNYVLFEEPDSSVNVRTFYKLATVAVFNKYLADTLKLTYTASY